MRPLPRAFRRAACQIVSILGLSTFAPNALQASQAASAIDAPSDLPRLAQEMSEQARTWRSDAWLVRIEVNKGDDSQPAEAFDLSFYVFSPSDGMGLVLSRRPLQNDSEAVPYEVDRSRTLIPIPDFAVDLPQALMAAQRAGMRGQLRGATLTVKTPLARPPVLVWSIRASDPGGVPTYFVDAFTGAHLTRGQVADPSVGGDTTLEAAERALKEALQHPSQVLPDGATPWMHFVLIPILNAKDVFECNALGGHWTLLRMCTP
jgi:hypothetical protein